MAANLLAIRRFVERFDRFCFPSKSEVGYTIPLLGLDASGKTSLLQRLKGSELEQLIFLF
jgi:GTPase SAR1 family protein